MTHQVEIHPDALSPWGRRVRQLQAWGWSYRAMAARLGTSASIYHEMVVNPRYDPGYSTGRKFLRFYVSQRIEQRWRASVRHSEHPKPDNAG